MFNEGIKEERDRFLKDLKESCRGAKRKGNIYICIYIYLYLYKLVYNVLENRPTLPQKETKHFPSIDLQGRIYYHSSYGLSKQL